ncbi:hypothetical protein KEM54_006414 [Ascosphaera aggregata]|nr:hypothetical protein KEM54_006414 [Ascosphaera aggregata]
MSSQPHPQPQSTSTSPYARATTAFTSSSSHDWTSEKKLLSALALLQDLESRTQNLRSLLPNRLFLPLEPVVDRKRETPRNPLPKHPAEMYDRLAISTREAIRELDLFKSDFTAPPVRAIFEHVDELMMMMMMRGRSVINSSSSSSSKSIGGKGGIATAIATAPPAESLEPVPLNTHWSRLYDANLKALLRREEEEAKKGMDIARREKLKEIIRLEGIRWKDNLLEFGKMFEVELEFILDVDVDMTAPSDGEKMRQQQDEEFTVRFVKRLFNLRLRRRSLKNYPIEQGGGEWHIVDNKTNETNSKKDGFRTEADPNSTFKSQIIDAMNSRDKKWDIAYLVTLLYSYTPTTPQKCSQCDHILDGNAHLAIARKPVEDSTAPGGVRWLPYHPGCL